MEPGGDDADRGVCPMIAPEIYILLGFILLIWFMRQSVGE